MATTRTCDGCTKEIAPENPIVMQLWAAPVANGRIGKQTHSDYTKRMDIGMCCIVKVNALGKWQTRKKQKTRVAA